MHAVAISGGGVYGAVALGALAKEFERNRFDPDILAGVSSGGLIATGLAASKRGHHNFGRQLARQVSFWMQIENPGDVWKKRALWPITCIPTCSVGKSKPLKKRIDDHIDVDAIRESERDLFLGVYDLNHRCYLEVDQNEENLDRWLLASASYPGFFPPVKIGDNKYLDGGIVNQLPSPWLYNIGCVPERIDLYICGAISPTTVKRKRVKINNIFNVFSSIMDGTYNEILWDDLFPYLIYQNFYPDIDIRVFSIKDKLDIGPLDFYKDKIKFLFDIGKGVEPQPLKHFYLSNVTGS